MTSVAMVTFVPLTNVKELLPAEDIGVARLANVLDDGPQVGQLVLDALELLQLLLVLEDNDVGAAVVSDVLAHFSAAFSAWYISCHLSFTITL